MISREQVKLIQLADSGLLVHPNRTIDKLNILIVIYKVAFCKLIRSTCQSILHNGEPAGRLDVKAHRKNKIV